MLRIRLLAMGNKLPAWANDAVAHYGKAMQAFAQFELVELNLAKRTQKNQYTAIDQEGEQLLAKIKPSDYVVAYEVDGKAYDTDALAASLQTIRDHYGAVILMIGGPEGLSKACKARANATWSLSNLTLPHALARVVVVESLYRSLSVLHNHPYHRKSE